MFAFSYLPSFFQIRHCKLLYTHTIEEIKDILSKVNQRLKTKNYTEV